MAEAINYAEPMVFLTKDGSVKPRVHIEAATNKVFICGLDFVREASVRPDMPPDEGNAYIFKAISANMNERSLIYNKTILFPGPYEKPRHCFEAEGIYLIYEYMDSIGLINKSYHKEVDSVLNDLIEEKKNMRLFLKMHDDGERAEQDLEACGRLTAPPVGSKFNADDILTAEQMQIAQAQKELVESLTKTVEVSSAFSFY